MGQRGPIGTNNTPVQRWDHGATKAALTIAEDARRGDLDGAEGAQMIQHHTPVAVHAGVVHKGPDVDGLTRVADARAHGDCVVT